MLPVTRFQLARRTAFALALVAGGPAGAQTAELPVFVEQSLILTEAPRPVGPAIALFNGRDLSDWTAWLGYADPAETYRSDHGPSLGDGGIGTMFTVVTEDGEPAIRVDGRTWGSLVHKGEFANYHLRLEFKWGRARHAPRESLPANNGLLYHSFGPPGRVWGTWMTSAEFEIMQGSTGMFVPVGAQVQGVVSAAYDPAIGEPHARFMLGGRPLTTGGPMWNVEATRDAEKPAGEWNVLDLYVVGERAIHVVNGEPVMAISSLCAREAGDAECRRLTRGRIQLQSEGAETFFRRFTLEPIDRLPSVELRSDGPKKALAP